MSIRRRNAWIGAVVVASVAGTACTGGKETSGGTNAASNGAPPAGAANAGWAMYNRGYDGERYAALDQLTPANVAGLKPVCEVKLGEEGTFQSGPVVVGDTLFVTTPHTTVALNATTCALIWRQVVTPKAKDVYTTNRGVAYADGKLFRGTPDGRLLALDAGTGKVLWDVQAGNPAVGEFTSSAPIAWHGLVFTGVAGSDWGVRGHMMAFDAATGKERWRFYTIPMDSQPGAETWKVPATAKRGGGAQWTSYALDTTTAELFVPVANPAPDFAPQTRPGANLYTNSVVVLDANTGALKWYYQLVPHDGFDYDLGAAPMLYTGSDGKARVALGSKDGYVYALDRGTHQPVFKTPVTTISNADTVPTTEGVRVCPGPLGGVEWNGPAYDPRTGLIYAGSVDWCSKYTTTTGTPAYTPGQLYFGTSYAPAAGDTARGWLTAIDAATGKVRWQFHAPAPIVAGVTPTAGGLVFNGDIDGNLYAFDATNGHVLYKYNTGGAVAGGVVTYAVNGKQYVATTSGNASRTTFNTVGSPTIVVLALGAPATPNKVTIPAMSSTSGGATPTEHASQGAKGSTTGP